ncbi:IS3 family transposase [Actinomadura sp. NTSP31]|uniref:IS3 family transposase n=1 Tax=Actinomadura sp. NTSP31 TaxID=1735447 RepID=UPI0035C09B0F
MAKENYSEEFKADAVALFLSTPSATYVSVARDLGVSRGTLRNWVLADRKRRAAAGELPGGGPAAEPGEAWQQAPGKGPVGFDDVVEAENRQLRARIRELEAERDILRRAAKYFGGRDELVSRFQFVDDHRELFSIKRLCHVLQVSRSGYYRWRDAAAARAERRAADAALAEQIRRIHAAHDGVYGSPRITAELRDQGRKVNHKRIERVMRAFGILGVHLRRRVRTTVPAPSHQKVPDLIRRNFTAPAPGMKYVGDITYLPVGDGKFLYLATVIDLCSRRLAGWSIADHMRTELVVDALEAAARTRGGRLDGAIFHSDHGAQYGSADFAAACARLGVTQSMGTVGTSADNAAAEAFNASLKRETLQGRKGRNGPRQARLAVFRWATLYNTTRRHSALGQMSPITYEQQSHKVAQAA